MNKDPIEISYDSIVIETDMAICYSIEEKAVWIPKSLHLTEDEGARTVEVPYWFALNKGLI